VKNPPKRAQPGIYQNLRSTFFVYKSSLFTSVVLKKMLKGSNCQIGRTFDQSGTDAMVFKIFSPKNWQKYWRSFVQTTGSFCKNVIITLVFEKNANFFSPKI
jgi:hypothetical protein